MMKLLVHVVLVLLLSWQALGQGQTILAIAGGTLIDGTGKSPLSHSVILISGDRIIRVGTTKSVRMPHNARRIDAVGKFVLPGLIDTHLHLEMIGLSDLGELPSGWTTPENLQELVTVNAKLDLFSGFTTVRDLGSTDLVLHVRDEINAGRLIGPRIFAAGMQLVKADSFANREPTFLQYDGAQDAQTGVRYLATLGADVIKIRLTQIRPIPSLGEVRAIVEEAHRLGLRATVHTDVPADDLVNLALDAGADGIEHNAPLRSQNKEALRLMGKRGISLMAGGGAFFIQRIDTLGLIDSIDSAQTHLLPEEVLVALRAGIDSLHKQTQQMRSSGWNAMARQASFVHEMQRAREAGVLLVFGTDCGAYGMIHGEQYKALYGESRIGSTPMQAIVMATRDAAKALGKTDELGTIEAGKLADLIIISADPLTDLRNLRQVFRVIKGGTAYDPATLISLAK